MKLRILQYLLCLLICVSQPVFAVASLTLQFQNKVFDPLQKEHLESRFKKAVGESEKMFQAVQIKEIKYYILQLDGPVQAGTKLALKALAVQFYDYVPQYAFLVKIAANKLDKVRATAHVRWVGHYSADLKVSSRVYSAQFLDEDGNVRLRVVAFPGEDAAKLQSQIEHAGGEIENQSASQWSLNFIVKMKQSAVEKLQAIEGVKWIEPATINKISNNISNQIIQSRGGRGQYAINELTGEGQIVAIADTAIDSGDPASLHPDFSAPNGVSRLLKNEIFPGATSPDKIGHGTHVAGILLGNGKASGADPASHDYPLTSFAGAAPEALLYFQTVGDGSGTGLPGIPNDLNELFQPAYDNGARIHSNSWGASGVGEYTASSVAVDQFTWTHKDFLPLFAAGNAGIDKDGDGIIDLYSIDSPATAKNCLSVGASESLEKNEPIANWLWSNIMRYLGDPFMSDLIADNPLGMAAFSNRGPTLDGRYKPEIVAPGTSILSTRSASMESDGWWPYNADYVYMGGTSMATPLVAGGAALLREYLIKDQKMIDPSAALLKTALIHGALDLAPGQYGNGAVQELHAAPDFSQGWGRLNLPGSVMNGPNYDIQYYDISDLAPVDTSYKKAFVFTAQSGTPLKATLGWTDYPGSEVVSGGLVNDLDLRIKTPDGNYIYPDNARHIGGIIPVIYGAEEPDYIPCDDASTYALRITVPDPTMSLESISIPFSSQEDSFLKGGRIAVYSSHNGKPGTLLYSHEYALFPASETGFPIQIGAGYDELFVSIEKNKDGINLLCVQRNIDERSFIQEGESWKSAGVTPLVSSIFRSMAQDDSQFDRINNIVSVTVPHASGEYSVEVSAHNIAQGPQPYALVISGLKTVIDKQPQVDPSQTNMLDAALLNSDRVTLSALQINKSYGALFQGASGDVVSYSMQLLEPQKNAILSMRYPVSMLTEETAGDLQLWALGGGGRNKEFSYPTVQTYANGHWWLTRVDGSFVAPQELLDSTMTYYVVSVILDNGSFDEMMADDGIIKNTQTLLPKRFAPLDSDDSGNSGGGCSIGAGNDYGTSVLLFLTFMMVGFRRYKKRLELS